MNGPKTGWHHQLSGNHRTMRREPPLAPDAASHCLYRLIRDVAESRPQATALLAPDRTPLNYSDLLEQIDHTRDSLLALGLGRGDRIATVLPHSSETSLAMICVMAFATATPINPRNAPDE